MKRYLNIRRIILALLVLFVLLVRLVPHWGEMYAVSIYPTVSSILSWISSCVFFSLTEWIVIINVWMMILYPLYAHFRKHRTTKRIALVEAENVVWMVVWFYLGWGLNYHRDSFYERMHLDYKNVDKTEFVTFLDRYTQELNASFVDIDSLDKKSVENEVKELYSILPAKYGLARPKIYQHPKALAFNGLFSSVGVQGFMGPFACESHVNAQVFDEEYAFVYAHELSHLLSVSNEAEASYWAFAVCSLSTVKEVRFSGYYGILNNVVRNARMILPESEYADWVNSIDPRIMTMKNEQNKFWVEQYQPILNDIQSALFDLLLKSNGISDGRKNYDQVVGLIIASEELTDSPWL